MEPFTLLLLVDVNKGEQGSKIKFQDHIRRPELARVLIKWPPLICTPTNSGLLIDRFVLPLALFLSKTILPAQKKIMFTIKRVLI